MLETQIKPLLQDIGAAANQLGHEVYIVGGYVRNKLYQEIYNKQLNQNYRDIDLVINTNAIDFTHKLQKYLHDNDPNHISFDIVEEYKPFGTIKIAHPDYPGYNIELASTRIETYPAAADFPKVEIIDDIKTDLPRRDFTINALLESLNKDNFGEIIDHIGGIDDLNNGLVRIFHDQSFIDDPTRIYRAARFMAEYEFKIEEHTLGLMQQAAKHPDFSQWLKKRKSRFTIELENIEKLSETRANSAKALLETLMPKP